jgi:hypothetical protein
MSQGYSLPLSPTGRASLVPSPPWHYVGDFVVVDYWADPAAVAAVLPPGMEPYAADPGRAAVIFADWQSCTTDQNELVDPARSQYKEAFIVVNAVLGDEHVDRAIERTTPFTADFQDLITRYAWGEIWARPGLDRRARSCITLATLVARAAGPKKRRRVAPTRRRFRRCSAPRRRRTRRAPGSPGRTAAGSRWR